MRENYPRCSANTHQEEGSNRPDGGWTINRNDRGNWTGGAVGKGILAGTKWGIAANSAARFGIDPLSIRTMTRAQADEIYRKYYWTDAWGDDWPMGFDQLTYDATVNSGAGRGPPWTCKALGYAKADRGAITRARMLDTNGRITACKKTAGVRMSFLQGIKGPSGWGTFGRGWGGRVQRMEAIAVKMCLEEGKVAPAEQTKQLEKEAGAAKTTSNQAGAGAATSGGSTVGGNVATGTQVDVATFDWTAWLFIGGLTVAGIIITGACLWLWFKHRERAKAYLDAARGILEGLT
jgi:lysozyme family protein